MPINLDNAFGVHAQALQLRARRMEVLASNIANVDTPNYKARDLDFQSMLRDASQVQGELRPAATQAGHIGVRSAPEPEAAVLYRTPPHASLDGNTVDMQAEKAAFARNAVEYQASLMFLNRRVDSLLRALKGE